VVAIRKNLNSSGGNLAFNNYSHRAKYSFKRQA